jgi:hypothetical protein
MGPGLLQFAVLSKRSHLSTEFNLCASVAKTTPVLAQSLFAHSLAKPLDTLRVNSVLAPFPDLQQIGCR